MVIEMEAVNMKNTMIRLMGVLVIGMVLSACSSTCSRETASDHVTAYKPSRGEVQSKF